MAKRKLVIFGFGDLGEVAHHYFKTDTDYDVAAFTLDRDYVKQDEFKGLPLLPYDEAVAAFPPDQADFFVALGYSKLNQLRREKYLAAKAAGYRLASYVSPRASVLNEGAIGDNCFILEDNTIQPFARIGSNVTMWSGNHIGHHSVIGDHCFLASHIVVSGGVKVGEACFVGVNATFRDHISIGEKCVIGAGAILLADAEPEGVYVGAATERSKVPSTRLRRI
jgi:sugar O-acyltransferase (sialic acid O-acetyltransferase NeuD family)